MARCKLTLKMNYLVIGCVALIASRIAIFANGQENVISIACHECWPYMEGVNCTNLESNETLYNCTNYGVWDLNVTCFSAFINLTGPETARDSGVYRSCALRHINYTDYCDFYRNYVSDSGIDIVSCVECYEDGCNTHKFTHDGKVMTEDDTPPKENSGQSPSMSCYIILLLILVKKLTGMNLLNYGNFDR